MKVLLVSGIYPPDIGGPAAQTRHIAQGLIRRGHEAHVVTTGGEEKSGVRDGVPVTHIAVEQQPGLHRRVRRNVRVLRTINQLLRQFRPDVLHANSGFGALAFWAGLAARWRGVPSVIKYAAGSKKEIFGQHDRDTQPEQETFRQQIAVWSDVERITFRLYSCLWATTPRYGEHLIHKFGVPAEKVWVHPNFIDLRPFQAGEKEAAREQGEVDSSDDLVLLTVARLRPWKGLEECIEMVAQLKGRFSVRLRVAGDGPEAYTAKLWQLAERLGVEDRVDFLGVVPHDQIAEEYRQADLFVLASRHEPFGIVLVEAMATGTPVVATKVGGIPTVVEDGVSARLVPARDVKRLSATVGALARDEEARRSLARGGRECARQFGLEAGLDALVERYASISSKVERMPEPIEL